MTNKHFEAILSKNEIAREITEYYRSEYKEINLKYLLEQLKDIEKYIGEGNQPSVEDIYKNNSQINRNFSI